MFRTPTILWRMLTGDLVRLLLLSAASLVIVIAFAATLRPVAEGRIGAADALKFMAYATLPMLQFALPFSAAFAATLAYHRFGADNESLAASSGGISYRALLLPAGAAGLVLAGSLGLLTNEVIPGFSRAMKATVARDIAHSLFASLERGESVEMEGYLVSADRTFDLGPDPSANLADRFILEGVVAVELGPDDQVRSDFTARQADVRFYRDTRAGAGEPATALTMTLVGVVGGQPGEVYAQTQRSEIGPLALPDTFNEDPDFYTMRGLRELHAHPDPVTGVDRARRELAALLARRALERSIRSAASGGGRLVLTNPVSGETSSLATRGVRDEGGRLEVLSERAGERVEYTRVLESGAVRRHLARRAYLTARVDERRGISTVTLTLEDVESPDAERASRERLDYDALRPDVDPAPALFGLSSLEALEAARNALAAMDPTGQAQDREALESAARLLERRIANVRREIVGVQHERIALPAACLIMTLLGAIMGLRLHQSLPLPVYLWSFFPALFCVISISGGASVAKDNAPMGVAVLWTGVGLLAAFTGYAFVQLRRH